MHRTEESLFDPLSFCPAGSEGIKTHVTQKCLYLWEKNPQGRAASDCFPPCLERRRVLLGVSQVQNLSPQSSVQGEFLLLTDSWKSRRQQRLLRLALLLKGARGVWTCWVSNMQNQSSGRARLSSCREYRVSLPKQHKCSAEMSWLIVSLCPGFPHRVSFLFKIVWPGWSWHHSSARLTLVISTLVESKFTPCLPSGGGGWIRFSSSSSVQLRQRKQRTLWCYWYHKW